MDGNGISNFYKAKLKNLRMLNSGFNWANSRDIQDRIGLKLRIIITALESAETGDAFSLNHRSGFTCSSCHFYDVIKPTRSFRWCQPG